MSKYSETFIDFRRIFENGVKVANSVIKSIFDGLKNAQYNKYR